jgi:8-oxo-dGTP pyrophosphatase MutT (NUDIX family)
MWALPKGNIGRGEDSEATALREVAEETGVEAVSSGKLGDVRYVYTRGGKRIFKIVSFYLLRYRRGRIDDLPSAFRHEVDVARWLPLEDAPRLLAYKSEREMAVKALAALQEEAV